MDIRTELEEKLSKIASKISGEEVSAALNVSKDLSKGDFASNIAMRISKKGDPMVTGERIVEEIRKDEGLYKRFEKIELLKPGFINFYLSFDEVIKGISEALEGPKAALKDNQELIFEFGDPKPFKEPHIWHLRNFILGEAICRILSDEHKIIRANYQGDVGMHVAKAIYGITKLGIDALSIGNLEEKAKFLGKAYAAGAKEFEENEEAKKDISEINKKVYEKDPEIMKIWEKGREISLSYFETLYKALVISYDKYYFESQTAEEGLKIVKENIGKVFEEHEGAVVFRGEDLGLHTRVFITSAGYATYEGKDLALAILKNKDFPKAASIVMTANEQVDYFKVLIAALNKINPQISEKTKHLSFGFVDLKEGKMSSRTGNIVPAFWLLEETRKRLKSGFKDAPESVLDVISIGAVKWSMLKFSRESNISFSIEESIQIEGNSGPYMQYSYARAKSLLGNSTKKPSEANLRENTNREMLALLRLVCQFNAVRKEAAEKFSPNILTNYLYDLAKSFNTFYEKEKVIGAENETEKIYVIDAVSKVLKNGLNLLGIDAPDKI